MRMTVPVTVIMVGIISLHLQQVAFAQGVSRAGVDAVRQLAIDAGQTSSTETKKPPKSEEAKAVGKAVIDSHRKAFFKRAYGKGG